MSPSKSLHTLELWISILHVYHVISWSLWSWITQNHRQSRTSYWQQAGLGVDLEQSWAHTQCCWSSEARWSAAWEESSLPDDAWICLEAVFSPPPPPPSVLIPFLPKWVFLGQELIIAAPKSFAVCFLFKYCISHQKESPAISCPCLVSATGDRDAGQTRGRSQWGDKKRRLEAGWGTQGVSLGPVLCGLQLSVLEFAQPLEPPRPQRHIHSAAYFCHYLMTYLHLCWEFPLKPYTVISLPHKLRLPAAAMLRDPPQRAPSLPLLWFVRKPFMLSPSHARLVPGTHRLHLMGALW